MSLTGPHHLFATVRDAAVNIVLAALRQDNPWLFSLGTPQLGGAVPPVTAIRLPILEIPDTPSTAPISFEYGVDLPTLGFDFLPQDNTSEIPPQLRPLKDNEFSLFVDTTFRLPHGSNVLAADLRIWLVASPQGNLPTPGHGDLGLSLRGTELVQLVPQSIENIVECVLDRLIGESILPRNMLQIEPIATPVAKLLLAKVPEIAEHRVNAFFDLEPLEPEPGGGDGGDGGPDLPSFAGLTPFLPSEPFEHLLGAADEDAFRIAVQSLTPSLTFDSEGEAFGFFYAYQLQVVPGTLDLIDTGDRIRLREWDLHSDLVLGWHKDLSDILPDFCIPEICIPIPPFGELCTPSICVDWPTIDITIPVPTIVSEISADFAIQVQRDLATEQWVITAIVDPATLDFDPIDFADTVATQFEDSLVDQLFEAIGIDAAVDFALDFILDSVLDLLDDLMETIVTEIVDWLRDDTWIGIGLEITRFPEILEFALVDFVEPADIPPELGQPILRIKIAGVATEVNSDHEFVLSAKIAVP